MSEPCLPLLALLLPPDELPLSEKKKKKLHRQTKWSRIITEWSQWKKKKTKKEKKKCKLCKPCESVTRPVETNGHRKSSETKLPSGPLFAPRDPARLVCLLLRRNCNIFVAARPSLPRPSMTPIHPPRAGQPTPREPPCLAIPRSVAVSTIHFAEGGRQLC